MPQSNPDVVVIGAGVIGLTTAVCLAETGRLVLVRTADPPHLTTSSVAGAMCGLTIAGSLAKGHHDPDCCPATRSHAVVTARVCRAP